MHDDPTYLCLSTIRCRDRYTRHIYSLEVMLEVDWSVEMTRTMACATFFVYNFMVRLVAYFAFLGFLVFITFVALKILGEWRERQLEEGESNPLIPHRDLNKIVTTSYGTYQQDPDWKTSSICSTSGTNSSKGSVIYDAKICIICYDELRNCFFVPCGHCATCFVCAQRIFYEENRNCPVCRRFIGKITRLTSS